jgi:hypothetical protein
MIGITGVTNIMVVAHTHPLPKHFTAVPPTLAHFFPAVYADERWISRRRGFPCCRVADGGTLDFIMLEKITRPATEQGILIFNATQTATVNYWAEKDSSGEWHGRVSHAEGHPDWHPIVAAQPGPFTLVMSDGRKLKVFLDSLKGSFHGTDEQAA